MGAYLGGKARIGERIWAAIRKVEDRWLASTGTAGKSDHETERLPYLEPFLGMGGVMYHFAKDNDGREFYGCDILEDIFEFWEAVTKHDWHPPAVEDCWTEEIYNEGKTAKPSALRCFIGSVASFNCVFFGGHFREPTHGRQDYYGQAVRKLEKWRNPMKKVIFLKSRSYHEFNPNGYLIYCDPPYRSRKLGSLWRGFDSNKFWETMRIWSQNNLVFVSEKEAPPDFIVIETFHSHLSGKKYTEYLFIHQDTARKLGFA